MPSFKKNPIVSLIVLAYNNKAGLETCLKSIANQSYKNIELVVVDNSPENYAAGIIKKFPGCKLISNKANAGACRAHNQGIKASNGKYVARIDDDIELGRDYVKALVEEMENDEKTGIAGGKIYWHHTNQLWMVGGKVNISTGANTMVGLKEADNGQYEKRMEMDYIGCCMLVRRDVFNEIGLIDERFFIHYEDIDFCVRAGKKGWKNLYVPRAILYHNQLLRKPSLNTFLLINRNRIKFVLKHLLDSGGK